MVQSTIPQFFTGSAPFRYQGGNKRQRTDPALLQDILEIARGIGAETKRKTESGSGQIVAYKDSLTEKYWSKMIHPPVGKYLKSKSTITYHQYCTQTMNWDAGRQGVQDMFCVYNMDQLMENTIGTANPLIQWPTAAINLAPDQTISGGGIISADVPLTRYIHLKSVKMSTEIVNLSSTIVVGQILWVMPKKLTVNYPSEEWQYQLLQEKNGQGAAQQQSLPGTNPSAGQALYYFVGKTPLTLGGFNKTYRVIHKDSFKLESGGNLKLYSKVYLNKTVSESYLRGLKEDYTGGALGTYPKVIPGVTLIPLMIARSVPVFDTTEGVDRMTYGTGKIGWCCSQSYSLVPFSVEDSVPYERIYPSIHNAGSVSQKVIGPDDTVIDTYTVT